MKYVEQISIEIDNAIWKLKRFIKKKIDLTRMNSSIFKITVRLMLHFNNITVIDNNEVEGNWYLIHWFHQKKELISSFIKFHRLGEFLLDSSDSLEFFPFYTINAAQYHEYYKRISFVKRNNALHFSALVTELHECFLRFVNKGLWKSLKCIHDK